MANPLINRDIDNAHVLDDMERARVVADRLIRRGVKVLEVRVQHARPPLVEIENDDVVCAALPPGTLVMRPGEKVFASAYEGCCVQWRKPA
jgi:hypothetical protein